MSVERQTYSGIDIFKFAYLITTQMFMNWYVIMVIDVTVVAVLMSTNATPSHPYTFKFSMILFFLSFFVCGIFKGFVAINIYCDVSF